MKTPSRNTIYPFSNKMWLYRNLTYCVDMWVGSEMEKKGNRWLELSRTEAFQLSMCVGFLSGIVFCGELSRPLNPSYAFFAFAFQSQEPINQLRLG